LSIFQMAHRWNVRSLPVLKSRFSSTFVRWGYPTRSSFASTPSEERAKEEQRLQVQDAPMVTVHFLTKGERKTVRGPVGMNILDLAHKNDIDLEGACEASLACSTCHVIVKDPNLYKKLGEPSDEENDMLDLAFGLTATSRLGCQIKLHPDLEGMELLLPAATRNLAVDGYKAKH